ncbi:MAG: Heimdall-CTERM domain-containing surface protein [Candidatus Thermoplasmatota archaeon]
MKRRDNKKIGFIIGTILLLAMAGFATATPTVELNPENPSKGGTATFTATFTDVTPNEVVIKVDECKKDLCYGDGFNETMTKNGDVYEATIDLKHSDATKIQYKLGYKTTEGWNWQPGTDDFVEVSLSSDSSDKEKPDVGIPGFEFLIALIAALVITMLIKRKRLR